MARYLVALSILISSAAAAQIFKWVDADGRTQFSDRPRPDAQQVGARPRLPASSRKDPEAERLGPYTAFEIVSPEQNQIIRQTEGSIPLSLLLAPTMQENHRLELSVDGAPVPVDRSLGTQLSLGGIAYGSHQAQARVLDAKGNLVATTPVVTFHLRKPLPPGLLP